MPTYRIQNGDCRIELSLLADCSVDSVVTDPPYELGFMGKVWDRSGIAYQVEVWRECLRVLKPGGYLLAFGGSRTYHRLACAIEDAGFEIRDQIQWIYGSGFPKSLDVSKAIDAAAGAEREVIGFDDDYARRNPNGKYGLSISGNDNEQVRAAVKPLSQAATEAAKQWSGWGTALKPAHEPIVLARKPLIGTVAENVLQHGTGGLNIAGCRVETVDHRSGGFGSGNRPWVTGDVGGNTSTVGSELGRWPANVIHDGSEEVLTGFPETTSGDKKQGTPYNHTNCNTMGSATGAVTRDYPGDAGSAARFFYCAKASREDRNDGLEGFPQRRSVDDDWISESRKDATSGGQTSPQANHHPTVKPTDLMRYLCRLVTPPNGTVLDPFCGSGSTGRGAVLEGFNFIGIELDAEYCAIAEKRIEAVTRQGILTFA